MIDVQRAQPWIDDVWGDSITPTLVEYIRIPNKSPAFDPNWAANGYMDDAVELAMKWAKAHLPSDGHLEVVRLEDRTPVIFAEIPGTAPGNVLLYGHLDKQPEMAGWAEASALGYP